MINCWTVEAMTRSVTERMIISVGRLDCWTVAMMIISTAAMMMGSNTETMIYRRRK